MASINLGRVKPEIKNNLTTTTTGAALDAAQGKALNDKITAANKSITDLNATINCQEVFKTGENLNNYRTTGVYYFGGGYTPTNIPVGTNGWLQVICIDTNSDVRIKQIWYRNGTLNSNDFMTYIRTSNGGSWSAWRKIMTSADQQCGSLDLTPTAVNTTISANIKFAVPFATAPVVQVTANTSVPQAVFVSMGTVGVEGFTVYLRRSDIASKTALHWTATARS